MENSLSYSVLNYLKRLKNQAKIEYDRLCSEVSSKQPLPGSKNRELPGSVSEGIRVVPRSPLKRDLISHPLLQGKFL
jgi:integrator complex subunit 6